MKRAIIIIMVMLVCGVAMADEIKSGFQTSDGKFFETKVAAEGHQLKIDGMEILVCWVDMYFPHYDKNRKSIIYYEDDIKYIIFNNADSLLKVLEELTGREPCEEKKTTSYRVYTDGRVYKVRKDGSKTRVDIPFCIPYDCDGNYVQVELAE